MGKTNTKAKDTTPRLAGGFGTRAARQNPEAQLRRIVLANLLWEDPFYQKGSTIAEEIARLVPQVEPERVAQIAREARLEQKLRHVPLFLAREMARLDTHKQLVASLLQEIVLRPDDLTEFLALYWQEKKQPLSKQVKVGLSTAFGRWDAYQLAKYKQEDKQIKLRDALFLLHPKPKGPQQEADWKALADGTLTPPDTWEVALSAGKDKKDTWERLIRTKKLGALAFVRNLRNMEQVGVDRVVIEQGFAQLNPQWLLPVNFLSAADHAPRWKNQLEDLMLRCLAQQPKLAGTSIFVLDVSGSMNDKISAKSDYTRLDAGIALTLLAREMCEHVEIYATAGSDLARKHRTARIDGRVRGFALADLLRKHAQGLGGGGIFTRQALEHIRSERKEQSNPERIMVFSDSQDCDIFSAKKPAPFGRHNYIVDVSAHTHGINYEGVWTAEIAGWSEAFLRYIAGYEQLITQ